MNVIIMANEWFGQGNYEKMKAFENEKSAIQLELKSRMGDVQRFIHKGTNTVLKFMSYPTYTIDNVELNKFLNNYGVLAHTVKFDEKQISQEVKDKIESFKLDSEYYIKITTKRVKKEKFDLTEKSLDELIIRWNVIKKGFDILSNEYEAMREKMNNQELFGVDNNKISFEHGTITRVKKANEYDIVGVFKEYGENFVIENATPVMTKIEEFMYQGYFLPGEVEKFKELHDINSRFIVMNLDDETKIMNYLGDRKVKASLEWEQTRKMSI